jgi:hypothetical protein
MRGTIRILVGLLVVFGTVGGIDNSTDSELLLLVGIASVGMLLMFSGVKAMKELS